MLPVRSAASASLTIELQPIGALVPDPKNARLHPERHIKQLAKSVEAFGFNCPVLIDRDNQVVAGHGRLLAVKHLGWNEVPVIRLEHLTPDQVRAYRIADNRLTDCSTWDERLLAEQLKELSEADLDFSLDAIGFDLPEIDLRIQSLGDLSDEPADESDTSVAAGPPVSVVGDVWQLGPHRIVCGSALEPATYEALLGSSRAAMVFTDPPYNVRIAGHVSGKGGIQHREFAMASGEMSQAAFTDFLSQALAGMKGACTSGALLYVCMDWRHLEELSAAGNAQQLELKNLCIWDKGCGGMGSLYRSQHELVFVYKAGAGTHTNNVQLGKFGRNRTNVWTYPGVNSFARETGEGNLLALHPTVKPVALVADALLDASERGDVVLDPFLGSGTTIIAAEKTGRIGMGIELDPHYVDTAVRRWQRLTSKAAVHAVTGQSFDAAANERSADADRLSAHAVPAYAEEGA
jgi:DNA modification methylase